MTLREAITSAVDHIRSTTADSDLLRAAKKLEEKAERMRAGIEKPAMWPHRCMCGERREEQMLVCWLCYREIPIALFEMICKARSAPAGRAA